MTVNRPNVIRLLGLGLGLLGLLLTLGAGCRTSPQPADERVELVFWTMQLADFKDTLTPMFAAYEAAHPNVRIKWVDIPGNEIEKRTLTAAMSPTVPDVINLNPDFSAVLASRRALLDMNRALTEAQRAAYLPVAWDAASIQLPGDDAPLAFGLPWYITSRVTLYNKRLLKQAGYGTPPGDYRELPAFARAVRQKTGQYALMPIVTQTGNFLKDLQKIGVSIYDAEGRAVFGESLEALAQLQRYLTLYRDGLIPPDSLTEDYRASVDRYQSGSLALLLAGPNFLNIVKENAPRVYAETGVAPQFPQDSDYVDFSEMLLVVPVKSRHPKEAVDFARFITNADNQLALARRAPVLPSVSAALRDDFFNQLNVPELSDRARSISARQLLSARTAYRIRPRQNEINERMNYFVQLALLGRMTPEDALGEAQDAVNGLLPRR